MWLEKRDSEDKKFLICPKCDSSEEYWGHNQEPLYCRDDGKKMVLKTKTIAKHSYLGVYDIKNELVEQYLNQTKEDINPKEGE